MNSHAPRALSKAAQIYCDSDGTLAVCGTVPSCGHQIATCLAVPAFCHRPATRITGFARILKKYDPLAVPAFCHRVAACLASQNRSSTAKRPRCWYRDCVDNVPPAPTTPSGGRCCALCARADMASMSVERMISPRFGLGRTISRLVHNTQKLAVRLIRHGAQRQSGRHGKDRKLTGRQPHERSLTSVIIPEGNVPG